MGTSSSIGARPVPFFALAFALVGGCGERTPDGIPHPNAENDPPADAAVISRDSVPAGLSDEALVSWRNVRDALLSARTTLTLGSNDEGPELFGYISDAIVMPDGQIVLLDSDAQEVRVFDRSGTHVGGFGGDGDGPGELRYMSSLALLPGGNIAVSGLHLRGVKVFSRAVDTEVSNRADESWTLEEILETRFRPNDLCSMSDGRLFAASHDRRTNIILSELADPARGFGAGYQYHNNFIQQTMSQGMVSCLDPQNRVAFGFDFLPMVKMYSAIADTLLWTARVDGHLHKGVIYEGVGEEGRASFSWGDSDTDHIASISVVGAGSHLLVQYGRRDGWLRRIVPQTFLVDAETGHGAFLGDDFPPLVSVQEQSYVALFDSPYPRVEVRTFELPPS